MAENLPSLSPRNYEEAKAFAVTLSKSNFCPKDYKDKPDDILIAAQMGAEVGLGFMQSVQNIAVINGRPSIWGDAMLALCQASGLMKFHREYFDKDGTAVCEVARKGDIDAEGKQVVHVSRFSTGDRDKAGLTGKGVHNQYPKRMLQMRARGFALRDKFADVLKGLIAREEAIDITPVAHVELPPDNLPVEEEPDKESYTTDERQSSSTLKVVASNEVPLFLRASQIQEQLVADEKNETGETSGGNGQAHPNATPSATLNDQQINRVIEVAKQHGWSIEQVEALLREAPFSLEGEFADLSQLSQGHFRALIGKLERK